MFRNQHARAFASYDSSDDKMEPEPSGEEHAVNGLLDLNFFDNFSGDKDKNSAAFAHEFNGYRIKTDLDRKLLLGIW